MKIVKTSDLAEGMVAADDIYTAGRQLLVNKGTSINNSIISYLKYYCIKEIPIVQQDGYSDAAKRLIPQKSVQEIFLSAIKNMASNKDANNEIHSPILSAPVQTKNTDKFRNYMIDYLTNTEYFKNSLNDTIKQHKELEVELYLKSLYKLIPDNMSPLEIFDMLSNLRNYDDATYIHSQNVALLCYSMGKWLNFSQTEINVLIACGLFHDIGKTFLPENILSNSNPLSDSEISIIRKHPLLGYTFLKNQHVDTRIKLTALNHHEKLDGSGYPNSLVGNKIDEFSKIVAIADVYDAMTSQRKYRKPICPFDVIDYLEHDAVGQYDPYYLSTFITNISSRFVHNWVLLNTGNTGRILMLNNTDLSHPVIKVGSDCIDLSVNKDIKIIAII